MSDSEPTVGRPPAGPWAGTGFPPPGTALGFPPPGAPPGFPPPGAPPGFPPAGGPPSFAPSAGAGPALTEGPAPVPFPPHGPVRQPAGGRSLVAQLGLEAALAVLAVGLVALALGQGADLESLMAQASLVGLAGLAFALSLALGAPNLSVGAAAIFAAGMAANLSGERDQPAAVAIPAAIVATVLIGVVMAALAGALSLPAWAVTLAGVMVYNGLLVFVAGQNFVPSSIRRFYPTPVWVLVVLVLSLVIGGIGQLRRWSGPASPLGAGAPAGAPTGAGDRWRVAVGIVASTALAAVFGLNLMLWSGGVNLGADQFLLGEAVAIALLAGTSVRRRRIGFLGVPLAAVAAASLRSVTVSSGYYWLDLVGFGVAALVGLVIGRLIDRIDPAAAGPQPIGPSHVAPVGPGHLNN